MKKIFGFLMSDSKLGRCVMYAFADIVATVPLAGLFSAFTESAFLECLSAFFWLFGVPPVIAILLFLANAVPKDTEFGFGCGLYYGSIVAYEAITWLWPGIRTEAALILGIVIVILCCYIAYIKKFK